MEDLTAPDRRTLLKLATLPMLGSSAASAQALPDKPGPPEIQASAFGVVADGRADDTAALRNAVRHCVEGEASLLRLPSGKMRLSGNVEVSSTNPVLRNRQLIIQGAGAGEDGSWLYFESGSLIVRTANHQLEDFRVTSATGNGVEIRAVPSPPPAPVRSGMKNIRCHGCAGNGIVISDSWIYLLENVFAMSNGRWGLALERGGVYGLGCNGLTLLGGEYQGNGRAAGAAGGGGVLIAGMSTAVAILGSSIEGNSGDGLRIAAPVRGLSLVSVYFEKNGANRSSCDITNVGVADPPLCFGAMIVNCNFTPAFVDGAAQERAIALSNFSDLKIINPIFFGYRGTTTYAQRPILVGETLTGVSSGWVEGGSASTSRYRQRPVLENRAARFGFPQRDRFAVVPAVTPDGALAAHLLVPVSATAAKRMEVYLHRPAGPESSPFFVEAKCRGRTVSRARHKALARLTKPSKQFVYLPAEGAPCDHLELLVRAESGPRPVALTVEVVTFEGVVGGWDLLPPR